MKINEQLLTKINKLNDGSYSDAKENYFCSADIGKDITIKVSYGDTRGYIYKFDRKRGILLNSQEIGNDKSINRVDKNLDFKMLEEFIDDQLKNLKNLNFDFINKIKPKNIVEELLQEYIYCFASFVNNSTIMEKRAKNDVRQTTNEDIVD